MIILLDFRQKAILIFLVSFVTRREVGVMIPLYNHFSFVKSLQPSLLESLCAIKITWLQFLRGGITQHAIINLISWITCIALLKLFFDNLGIVLQGNFNINTLIDNVITKNHLKATTSDSFLIERTTRVTQSSTRLDQINTNKMGKKMYVRLKTIFFLFFLKIPTSDMINLVESFRRNCVFGKKDIGNVFELFQSETC